MTMRIKKGKFRVNQKNDLDCIGNIFDSSE